MPLSLRCKYMHMHHFLKPLFALSNPHAKHKYRSLSNYPRPLLFLSPELLSVVVYLLLPYNFVYKTLAYIFNTGFVLNTCRTVNTCTTLFSKRIWLLKPCKNVCSCQKGHVNTSLILEHRKDHGKQNQGRPSYWLGLAMLPAGNLNNCNPWAIHSGVFTPHKKQTTMFMPASLKKRF